MGTTTPFNFIKRGNLFVVPVGPSTSEVPYPSQTLTRPPDYSLWVRGEIQEPGPHLDSARMSTRLYREVRADLTRYSPIEVTRSAIRRSEHAYVGVIDSRGTPYYFALDSRGVSVRKADPEEAAFHAFDRMAEDEHMSAVRHRRSESAGEMRAARSEDLDVVVTKGLRYGKKIDWRRDVPGSTWWKNKPKTRGQKNHTNHENSSDSAERAVKALPREKDHQVKKTPSRKAEKKKVGSTGKTRYTYPQEKSGSKSDQVPLVAVGHDDSRNADPAELANQLGVSIRTLKRIADRLGSEKFSSYMRSKLKRFSTKHNLDPDYWGTLYESLTTGGALVIKGENDSAWKEFGNNVNTVASSVPDPHPERIGKHKVFIHHIHETMQKHGLYHGSLDQFKGHVVEAHRRNHLTASRADFIGGMDPNSVKQSESKIPGATFHFVEADHDPKAAKKLTKPSGTSRGKSGDASAASAKAADASLHANKVGTQEAHLVAMTAHHHAGVAHQRDSGSINHKTALRHFNQAMTHLAASKSAG